jgi:ABC-type transporter MlaC component
MASWRIGLLVMCLSGLSACSSEANAPKTVSIPSSTGPAPAPVNNTILEINELPGAWVIDAIAPDAGKEQSDARAQELFRCLNIPETAQPAPERSAFSRYFAQSPRETDSVVVNTSATRIAEPSLAVDNIRTLRSDKVKECYEPSMRTVAMAQYQAVGYDVKDATVSISPLDNFQKDDDRFAFRATIDVSLTDGQAMKYYIDNFGFANGVLYTTLTTYRADSAPQQDLEKNLLDRLHKKTTESAKKL